MKQPCPKCDAPLVFPGGHKAKCRKCGSTFNVVPLEDGEEDDGVRDLQETVLVAVCNSCGTRTSTVWSGRCTNGRCSECHRSVCFTPDVHTHGFGKKVPERVRVFREIVR